jgi:hypothetical protein
MALADDVCPIMHSIDGWKLRCTSISTDLVLLCYEPLLNKSMTEIAQTREGGHTRSSDHLAKTIMSMLARTEALCRCRSGEERGGSPCGQGSLGDFQPFGRTTSQSLS